MAYHVQGTLYIDAAEFWGWVREQVKTGDATIFSNISFDDYNLIVSVQDSDCKYNIDLVELWTWVAGYTPKTDTAEVAYGVPRLTNFDLEIDFVASTTQDPFMSDVVKQWDTING